MSSGLPFGFQPLSGPPNIAKRCSRRNRDSRAGRAISCGPTRDQTSMPIALSGNGSSWERGRLARIDRRRSCRPICERDTSVRGTRRSQDVRVRRRSDSPDPGFARANRFRSVKWPCGRAAGARQRAGAGSRGQSRMAAPVRADSSAASAKRSTSRPSSAESRGALPLRSASMQCRVEYTKLVSQPVSTSG